MALLGLFVQSPWLGVIPATLFALLYRGSKRRLVAATALLWVLYSVYEYGMRRRWLCTGECNIRVDLLLLYPVLVIVSVTAAIVGFVAVARRRNAPSSRPE